ncbi:hypothetical protein LCGC14_0598060 [marine sediment metagenome]|uniref:Uncharacterized protein n=1 Tax=marine sediment metagenome TaxID=412755 RepID=A0A0F9RV59_9ZZZZ
MLYRIQIEQRFDKQKLVIGAVKELTSDFVILTGMAYFGNNHRPCQVIEINHKELWPPDVSICIAKLKKILNMPHILVMKITVGRTLY